MRRTKKSFWKPVVIGFGTVYLLTMALSTVLVKEKFTEDYAKRFEQLAASMLNRAEEREFAMEEEGWSSENVRRDFYQSLANGLWEVDDEAMQISLAFYDEEKRLLSQTRDTIGGNSVWDSSTWIMDYPSYALDDFLSSKEKEELAGYCWKNMQSLIAGGIEEYRVSILTSPNMKELWGIYVQQITWTEEKDYKKELYYEDPLTGKNYSYEIGAAIDYETGEEIGEIKQFYETDSKIVWQWMNPEISAKLQDDGKIAGTSVTFPYMSYRGSYETWQRWNKSQYLHDFPIKGEFSWEKGIDQPLLEVDSNGFYSRRRYQLQVGMVGEPFSYMEIRMESNPWLAAVNYMKYVYLAGLLLTLAWMAKIINSFQKIYESQAALEETRRDFTNAMAHELKTPLGVIRNFAENLMEHNMEEKRDYYLSQIIGQTEEMDRLVEKMIEISKLDSEELILKKETVSFIELIKEQMARFEPMVQEKNLKVEYQENGDFLVNGDREYLSKAVWNLLSNAVEYNIPDGSIIIKIEKDQCTIANTGPLMGEEELLHAFDLFYTHDKSRSGKERHMGMGLFLAKKILGLHEIGLTLENTNDKIQAIMKNS